MIGLIMLLELLVVIFLVGCYIFQLYKVTKNGSKILQEKMNALSRIFVLVGIAIIIFLPRMLDVRYNNDDGSAIIYIFISFFGFAIFFIGARLRIFSYKEPEHTPKWAKRIISIFS